MNTTIYAGLKALRSLLGSNNSCSLIKKRFQFDSIKTTIYSWNLSNRVLGEFLRFECVDANIECIIRTYC